MMKMKALKVTAVSCFVLTQLCAHATEGSLFNVVATGTPANVSISLCLNATAMLSCEKETVSALDLLISPTISNRLYAAGIIVNTPGYTIASLGIACTQLDNGYCLFEVSSTAPKSISLVNTTTKSPRFAYVGAGYQPGIFPPPSDSAIDQCPINSDGSLGACTPLGGFNSSFVNLFQDPVDIAFNPAGTIAYIANYGGSNIIKCNVDAVAGTFSGCIDAGVVLSDPPQGISLDAAGTHAFIGTWSFNTPVTVCGINSSGDFITPCSSSSASFDYASNVIFNAAGNAYVGNSTSAILLCDDTLTSCTPTPSSPTVLDQPLGLAFNPAQTIIYSANGDASLLYKCPVNAVDGTLTCTVTGGSYNFPAGIAVNAAGTFAYVVDNQNDTVSTCAIDSVTNEISSTCTILSDPNFALPFGITLLY
ncbi:MAG: hypothetical protein ACHQAX_08650 [Gammaproteobacteria bacterium]